MSDQPRMPCVVYAPGVWDLLHRGHLNLLWASRQLGDILIVGVVWDSGVHAYKGLYPTDNLQLRMRRIGQLGFVDVVVEQRTTDPTPELERFRPDILTHGSDWTGLREGQETLQRLGIEFVTLPYTADVSSTLLRRMALERTDPEMHRLVQREMAVT